MADQNPQSTGADADFSVPLHQSLLRPMLLLGAERELILALGIMAGVFIVSLFQLWAAIFGLILWAVGAWVLTRAANFDPQLSKTFGRSLRYRKLYKSAATPFAAPQKFGD
jgi:type IV secretory pathway TrbD component